MRKRYAGLTPHGAARLALADTKLHWKPIRRGTEMLLISFRLDHSFAAQSKARRNTISGDYMHHIEVLLFKTLMRLHKRHRVIWIADILYFLFLAFWCLLPVSSLLWTLSLRGRPRGIVPVLGVGVLWTICFSKWRLAHLETAASYPRTHTRARGVGRPLASGARNAPFLRRNNFINEYMSRLVYMASITVHILILYRKGKR